MSRPLVTERWRRPAFVATAFGAAVVVGMGVWLHHGASTSFDNWAVRNAYHQIGRGAALRLLDLSSPLLTFGVVAVVTVGAVIKRRWDLAVVAALGPALAVVLAEKVLKPIIARYLGPGTYHGSLVGALAGSFPSGHESGVASAAVVLLVAGAQFRLRPPARIGLVVVLVAWTVLAAVGLVRNYYHYATDTIGAIALSMAVVLGAALLVDRYQPRAWRRAPTGRDPARQFTRRS